MRWEFFYFAKKGKLEGKSSPTNIRFDFHSFWKCPRKRNIQNGKISFIASQACNPSAHKNSNSLHMLALHKNHPSITLGTGFHHRLSEGVHPNKILVFLKNSPPRFRENLSPHPIFGMVSSQVIVHRECETLNDVSSRSKKLTMQLANYKI